MRTMNIKKAALIVATACLMATPMAFAQAQNSNTNTEPHSHARRPREMRVQHRVGYLATVLSLTPAQQQKATSIFTDAAKANAPVIAKLRTERKDLGRAVKSNEPANSIKDISNAIGKDAGELAANEATAREQFYQMLNSEQQNKLEKLHSEHFGHRGFGMGWQGF